MTDRFQKIQNLFHAALEIAEGPSRQSFLENACGDDRELFDELKELLLHHESAPEDYLSNPPNPADLPTAAIQTAIEKPGVSIGRYKLLQQIGEGGFGVVFMAEQMTPVRRRVALKIIKPGMDSRDVIARFESERQALAMMDHPNIARVLDAGQTEQGRPFFVMELVHGIPITTFCDKNRLPITDRLELFNTVCDAIQHAHQKGIIHRDIKPSNVLVTLYDGRPVVKVIDFGVAKALSQPLSEKTLFTAFGQVIGTPAYMSPEQAEMSGLGVDTRSDIYSLGVLLYELLTGSTPLDQQAFRAAGLARLVELIRDQELLLPSLKVSSLGQAATTVAASRRLESKRLRQLLRGDLDWIVMKALEKDRMRRYESASALSDDVKRHLRAEPVQAAPPSIAYRVQRFVRKHRAAVTAAAAIWLALLVGLVASVILYYRAEYHRLQAVQSGSALQVANVELLNANNSLADQRRELDIALREKSQALDSQTVALRRAEALKLSAQSSVALQSDPALGLLLAIEAAQREPEQTQVNQALIAAIETCNELRTTELGKPVVRAVFSPDQQRVAVVFIDGDVSIFETLTGRPVMQLACPDVFPPNVFCKFSSDGQRLMLTFEGYNVQRIDGLGLRAVTDRGARVFDIESGQEVVVLHHDQAVADIVYHAGIDTYVTGDTMGRIYVWNGKGERLQSFVVRNAPAKSDADLLNLEPGDDRQSQAVVSIQQLAISADGRWVGVALGQPRESLPYSENPLSELDPLLNTMTERGLLMGASTSWQYLPSRTIAEPVRMIELATGREATRYSVPRREQVKSLTFVGEQNLLAVSTHSDRLLVWQAAEKQPLFSGMLALKAVGDTELPDLESFLAGVSSPFSAVGIAGPQPGLRDFCVKHHLGASELLGLLYPYPITLSTLNTLVIKDRQARYYSSVGHTPESTCLGHRGPIVAACLPQPGLAATVGDTTLRVWRLAPVTYPRDLIRHSELVTGACFSGDGRHLATWSEDKSVCLWDLSDWSFLGHLSTAGQFSGPAREARGAITLARFSPDNDRLAVLSSDTLVATRTGSNHVEIDAAGFTPLRVWNVAQRKLESGLRGNVLLAQPENPLSSAFADMAWLDGNKLMVTADSNRFRHFIVDTNGYSSRGSLQGLSVEQEGKDFSDSHPAIRIWDAATGQQLWKYAGESHRFQPFISRDGRWGLVRETAGWRVVDIVQRTTLGLLASTTSDPTQVMFDPTGTRVIVQMMNRVLVFDCPSGNLLWPMMSDFLAPESASLPANAVVVADWTPDGKHVAIGRLDGVVVMVRADDGVVTARLRGHRQPVNHIAFSTDGLRMATTSDDGTARVWDLETLTERVAFVARFGEPLRGSTFSPDGQWLITWCGEFDDMRWDFTTDRKPTLFGGEQVVRSTMMALKPYVRAWSLDPLAVARKVAPRALTPDEIDRFGL